VYPGLIILNGISMPREAPQVILNLLLSIMFLVASLMEAEFSIELSLGSFNLSRPRLATPVVAAELGDLTTFTQRLADTNDVLARVAWTRLSSSVRQRIHGFATNRTEEAALRSSLVDELNRIARQQKSVVVSVSSPESPEVTPGLQVLRVAVLTLLTFSVYGMQVLLARQRQVMLEQQAFLVLTERLRTAGRVAAEFAHQIKNPLSILTNVIFSLEKSAPNAKPQVEIIREEVSKCDRIITQIMGYGELNEGRIERLEVARELESAIRAVFPPGLETKVQLRRSFSKDLPPLLMQRRHLADAVGNLILNAREAVADMGTVYVSARRLEDDAVEILVRDDGPGIAPEKLGRIFEAYYTTKPKGTGLGLAIVKHNVELYSGRVQVQSELGKGAEFILSFPGKTPTN
jgi:signal transduction histidine kinase